MGSRALTDSLPPQATSHAPSGTYLVSHSLELVSAARNRLAMLVEANRDRDAVASARLAGQVRQRIDRVHELLAPIKADPGADTKELDGALGDLETAAAPQLAAAFQPPTGALWGITAPSKEDRDAQTAWEKASAPSAGGVPLPGGVRSKMEHSFGADFSSVRVHEDGRAGELGAQAYAQGDDIHFAPAQYDPNSEEGQELLGHELTHVVQQREGRASAAPQGKGGVVTDPTLEAEADEMGARAARGDATGSRSHQCAAAPPSSTPAIQRKVPGPDTSYGINVVWQGEESKLLGGKITAKWKAKLSGSVKGKGTLSAKHGASSKTAVGANDIALERARGEWDVKFKAMLVKNVTTLDVANWIFDVDIPVNVTFDTRGLEAALTARKLELKLMSVFAKLEGDFSGWFDAFHAKGELGIEFVLGADLSKLILEAANAGRDQLTVAQYEKKLAESERRLARLRPGARVAPDGPPLGPMELAKQRREIQRELDQLRGMRGKMNQLREQSIEKLKTVADNLEKLPGGKLVKKLGGKALATVFKKFIPVYNVLSTAQDIYEAADFLANLNWTGIAEKIVDGDGNDGQATVLGDGSVNEPGTGIAGEGQSDVASDGPADAAGFQRELDARENVELHASAAAVMGSLLVKETIAGRDSAPIPDDEKRLLNATIPEDLTEEEIEEMSSLVARAGATQTDRVTAAIEALRVVRPNGERKQKVKDGGIGSIAPTREHDEARDTEKAPKAREKNRENASTSTRPGTWIVDPAVTLREVIKIDEKTRQPVVPRRVEFPGFSANIVVDGVAQASWDGGGPGAENTFIVRVTITPATPVPAGTMLKDGRRIERGEPLRNVTVDGVRGR